MTYQEQFMRDRFAQIAVNMPQKYKADPHALAWYLAGLEHKRGRPMTDDHLRQEAVKWAKSR